MSDRNEKFLSESLLKDKPKKKLSLMLGDGVVTTQKIHDGAVNEGKLSDSVNNKFTSLDHIIKEVSGSINDIQEQVNRLSEGLPEGMILEGDTKVLEVGVETDLTLTAKTSSGAPADWKVFSGDSLIGEYTAVDSIEHTVDDIYGGETFRVECTVDDYTYKGYWQVGIVYPVYAGGYASTVTDYSSLLVPTTKQQVSEEIDGLYDITVTQGQRMFFAIPEGTAIEQATLNGFEVPLEIPVKLTPAQAGKTISYYFYKSSNTYQAGTYTIAINGYKGTEAESIRSLGQSINNNTELIASLQNMDIQIDDRLVDVEEALEDMGTAHYFLTANYQCIPVYTGGTDPVCYLQDDIVIKGWKNVMGKTVHVGSNNVIKLNGLRRTSPVLSYTYDAEDGTVTIINQVFDQIDNFLDDVGAGIHATLCSADGSTELAILDIPVIKYEQ